KTARVLPARFLCADVRFATHLHPNIWIGLGGNIAERSVSGCAGPFGHSLQFALLGSGKKFACASQCALEPAWTKIILPAFHQRCATLDCQHSLHNPAFCMLQL